MLGDDSSMIGDGGITSSIVRDDGVDEDRDTAAGVAASPLGPTDDEEDDDNTAPE